jgi:NAD(P)-dependent dehydrogenase (short-subunit alcohol dehydrogenase family)
MPSGERLGGKTAVIVGAGQTAGETIGNGRATSILFAREGARLLLVDRDEASVNETAAMIAAEGGHAEVYLADITTEEACAALAGAAVEHLGRVDILHNNVGIGHVRDGAPLDVPVEIWDRIMNVNLRAMWLTCKHVIPVMREQGGGAVVNISSIAAVASAPSAFLTAYKVSKAGINALTQHLALSNASHGVRVNTIMPGLIDTPMGVDSAARARGMSREELAAARARTVPSGHQGTGWDIAYAALYLASDEASFVNGVILPVDGGQIARVG